LDNLYWLDRIQPSDLPWVGNHAFNLSQLMQHGYPVLPGFVVPAKVVKPNAFSIAFWEFIEILGESEPMLADLPDSSFHVDVDNSRQLQQVAQQIRQQIIAAPLPTLWESLLLKAVESIQAPAIFLQPSLGFSSNNLQISRYLSPSQQSQLYQATKIKSLSHASYQSSFLQTTDIQPTGILESYICPHQPEAIITALKQVWAELFRARSLFYWQRNQIGLQQVNLAVLIQPTWEAIASGILKAEVAYWQIEATWGDFEAIAKGEVLPDYYQLEARTGKIKTQRLGSKTRAYRLLKQQDSSQFTTVVKEPYILSEEQQKQYALPEKYLKQLIKLCQRIATQITPTFSLEWKLYQIDKNSEPQLYIQQLTPQIENREITGVIASPSDPISPTVKVRGLPAASGRVTAAAYVIIGNRPNPEEIGPGKILIAQSIAPDWLPLLQQAAGVVTEQGGMTSHAAIIARELGIPAIVRAIGVTQLIQSDEILLVNGDTGEIHSVGDRQAERMHNYISSPSPSYPSNLNRYPIATQLLVNLSQPLAVDTSLNLSVDGVGLLRSELMMLNALENLHPSEWLRQGRKAELLERLQQLILQVTTVFVSKPVFYRSLDWRSHEFQFLTSDTSDSEPEANPMLGLRGTLRYLRDPSFFDLELEALAQVQAQGYTNVKLLLPFVRTVEEFIFCKRRVEQAGLSNHPNFQLWIMAEVPSVLFLLPEYVKAGVQGISIGTNDLTQLLLAVDRDQEYLGLGLNGCHSVVKQAIKQLIETAKIAGIPCSICGQATVQYPELIDLLIKWGITSISVDVNDVERTYTAIARAEQRLLLEAARSNKN
jgi:pyruvate,water dikinase